MMEAATKVVLTSHRSAEKPSTLLVDEDLASAFEGERGVFQLSKTKLTPKDMWACRGVGTLKLIVFSAPRSAKELFQVLALSERLIQPGGAILVLCRATDYATETRIEATEIFCGAYSGWERRLIDGFVIELQKKKVEVPVVVEESKLKKKVVSLSIFNDYRDLTDHWRRMPEMVAVWLEAHRHLFPGYELWVYHDESIYASNAGEDLFQYAKQGFVKLIYMSSRPGQGKTERMLHRLCPLWDEEVSHVFCRDLDSIPTWVDRMVSEEFVQSGCAAGVLHASSAHVGMLGGLCHFDAKQFRDAIGEGVTFGDFIAASGFNDVKFAIHGSDQEYLNQIAAKLPSVLEHQLFTIQGEDGTRIVRPGAWSHSMVRTELQAPSQAVLDSVSERDREGSNRLINYPGASGFRMDDALEFYQVVLPNKNRFHAGRVVLSSDLNSMYSFFAPLSTLLWTLRGYRPILFLVGTASKWHADAQARLALEHSREVGAEIYFVPEVEGVRTSTVAQIVRCVASALRHVDDQDYLLTSDIDMFPLGPWVGGNRDTSRSFQIYFSNAYSDPVHWPISYLGGKAKAWREMMGCERGQLEKALYQALEHAPKDEVGAWNWDEKYVSRKIADWREFPNVQMIDRTFVKGEWRLDRSGWDEGWNHLNGSLDGVADAHLPRPGYDENWSRIRPILECVLSPDRLKWADAYHRAWCDAGCVSSSNSVG